MYTRYSFSSPSSVPGCKARVHTCTHRLKAQQPLKIFSSLQSWNKPSHVPFSEIYKQMWQSLMITLALALWSSYEVYQTFTRQILYKPTTHLCSFMDKDCEIAVEIHCNLSGLKSTKPCSMWILNRSMYKLCQRMFAVRTWWIFCRVVVTRYFTNRWESLSTVSGCWWPGIVSLEQQETGWTEVSDSRS